MDPADIINSFATGTYTVTRRAAPTLVNGKATPGSTTTFSILGSIVPASGRDLLRLPEGQRSKETRIVFTATELKIASDGSAFLSDVLAIDGLNWEVQQVARWDAPPGTNVPFWKCIVQAAR